MLPDDHDPYNTKRPEVYSLKGIQWLLFYPAAWILWLYYRSLRIRVSEQDRQVLGQVKQPRIIIMWHNRSLIAPEALRRIIETRGIRALISPSKIAAWEVALFEFMNFQPVRGSTTRRSIQAAMEMIRALRAGDDVGITPDGPSGPLYTFQEGAVAIARKTGVPFFLVMPNCRAAVRLNTWDRHLIPLPFASVNLRLRVIRPDDPVWQGSDSEVSQHIRRVCLEMTEDPFKVNHHE